MFATFKRWFVHYFPRLWWRICCLFKYKFYKILEVDSHSSAHIPRFWERWKMARYYTSSDLNYSRVIILSENKFISSQQKVALENIIRLNPQHYAFHINELGPMRRNYRHRVLFLERRKLQRPTLVYEDQVTYVIQNH